eukprot:TRINITY_DN29_c0_g2_i1.p1 TRINITY_DN29_c0_g2~~TRINITY_DN29_c0_g2_i1.p1  ORF type:complete len:365 (-),score=61.79 TRINITY_DN29_c0_g2_i1:63-1076(-)
MPYRGSLNLILLLLNLVGAYAVVVKPGKRSPPTSLAKLRAQLGQLREHAKADARVRAHEIDVLRQRHEQNLSSQQAALSHLSDTVKSLRGRLKAQQSENSMKQQLAEKLMSEVNKIVVDARAMQANLTSISENLSMAADMFSYRSMQNVTELTVLTELDEHDAFLKEQQEHAHLLRTVSRASLLQTSNEVAPVDAERLLANVVTSMDNLAREGNRTVANMTEEFERRYEEGEQKRLALFSENEKLDAGMKEQMALRAKLDEAINRLSKTKNVWRERSKALRQFLRKLAKEAKQRTTGSSTGKQAIRAKKHQRAKASSHQNADRKVTKTEHGGSGRQI